MQKSLYDNYAISEVIGIGGFLTGQVETGRGRSRGPLTNWEYFLNDCFHILIIAALILLFLSTAWALRKGKFYFLKSWFQFNLASKETRICFTIFVSSSFLILIQFFVFLINNRAENFLNCLLKNCDHENLSEPFFWLSTCSLLVGLVGWAAWKKTWGSLIAWVKTGKLPR